MTLRRFFPLVLIAVCFAFLQADSQAGDKDKKKKTKAVVLKLKDGKVSVEGMLTEKEPLYKDKKGHKLYVLKMEEGKTYTIDMISKDFDKTGLDPYLFLENSEGQVVAFDDDGGGFPNARITYKAAKTGNYDIICTYFGLKGVGAFTLSVSEADGK